MFFEANFQEGNSWLLIFIVIFNYPKLYDASLQTSSWKLFNFLINILKVHII